MVRVRLGTLQILGGVATVAVSGGVFAVPGGYDVIHGADEIVTGLWTIGTGDANTRSFTQAALDRETGDQSETDRIVMRTDLAMGVLSIGGVLRSAAQGGKLAATEARATLQAGAGQVTDDIAVASRSLIENSSGRTLRAAEPIIVSSGVEASSVSMSRAIGNLGGRIVPTEYIDDMRATLEAITHTRSGERIHLTIEMFERGTSGEARALYEASRTGSLHEGVVRIPSNATFYEIQHELQHAFHHVESGRDFFRLTEAGRETEVYHRLRQSPYWRTFSREEVIDAYRQIMRASNRRGS